MFQKSVTDQTYVFLNGTPCIQLLNRARDDFYDIWFVGFILMSFRFWKSKMIENATGWYI